jgi:hypothetical protein
LSDFLDKYYDKNSYQANSRIEIDGQEYPLELRSPKDQWRFMQRLGLSSQMSQGLTIESVSYDVEGNPLWGFQKTSTWNNFFLRSDAGNEVDLPGGFGQSRAMGDIVRARTIVRFLKDQVESPLFSSSSWDSKKPNSNNILLNNKMDIENVSKIDGMTFHGKGIPYENLMDADKFNILFSQTKQGLLSKGGSVRMISAIDTMADRTTFQLVIWKYKKLGKMDSLYKVNTFAHNMMQSIEFKSENILDCLKDISNYYTQAETKSRQKWTDMAGGFNRVDADSEVGKKMIHDMIKNKDYVLSEETVDNGDGTGTKKRWLDPGLIITQPANPLKGITIPSEMSAPELSKLFAKVREAFHDHFNTFGKIVADLPEKALLDDDIALWGDINIEKLIKEYRDNAPKIDRTLDVFPAGSKESNAMKDYFAGIEKDIAAVEKQIALIKENVHTETLGDYIEDYSKAMKQAKLDMNVHYEEMEDEIDFEMEGKEHDPLKPLRDKKGAVVGLIRKMLRTNNYMHDGKLHPLLEVMFWNHYITNETMSHLLRGTVYDFKNANDFIKRAATLLSPGTPFNTTDGWSNIGRQSRVMYMSDINGMNELFGVTSAAMKDLTNGMILHNPLFDKMLYIDSGGQAGGMSTGSKKTVNSYYDHVNDRNIIHKGNAYGVPQSQLDQSRFYQEITRMMLGGYVYDKFQQQIKDNKGDYDTAVSEMVRWLKTPEGQPYRKQMVDYICFNSVVKSGETRMNPIQSLDGSPTTIDNAFFNPIMNNEDNVVYINNDSMLFQLNQRQNPYGSVTTLPLGIGHVVSTMDHNKMITDHINKAITTMTDAFTDKISELSKGDLLNYIRKNAINRSYDVARIGKKLALLEDPNMDINIVRSVAMQMFLNDANDNLRPKVPGAFHIQAPAFTRIFTNKEGQTFTSKDLGLPHDGVEVAGYTTRQLKPRGYSYETKEGWKDVTTREELSALRDSGAKLLYRPAEVIAPFRYMHEFGLDMSMTLQDCMQYLDKEGKTKKSLLQSYNNEISRDELFGNLSREFEGFSVIQILNSFSPKMKQALSEKWMKKVHATMLDPENTGELSKKEYDTMPTDMEYDNPKATNVHDFLDFLSTYFDGFNRALEIYSVRIPTSGANMGTMAKIVAFANDAENLIYTNPEENFINDSDYDGDALNVIYRAMDQFGKTGYKFRGKDGKLIDPKKYSQNTFFNSIERYYKDTKNMDFILTPLSTDSIEKFAETMELALPKEQKYMVSNPGLSILNSRIIYDGNRMIGHFVSLNNFMSTFLSLDHSLRKELFPNSTFLADETMVADSMNFVTSLVQLATINAGKGGLLGRLNINRYTSQLISGLVFEGVKPGETYKNIEEKVLTILNSDEVKSAVNGLLSTNTITEQYPKKLWDKLKSKELRDAFVTGEQIRRMGDFVALEKDISGDPFELYKHIKNIQKDIGADIDYLIDNVKEIKKNGIPEKDQMDYFKKNYFRNYESKNRTTYELAVHSAFNLPRVVANLDRVMSYVKMLKTIDESAKKTFYIDGNLDPLIKMIEDKTGRNELWDSDNFTDIEDGIEKRLLGLFLDRKQYAFDPLFVEPIPDPDNMTRMEKKQVRLSPRDIYSADCMKDRSDLVMLAGDYVQFLQKKYSSNQFINSLTFNSRRGDPLPIMEIPKSNAIDENREKTMAADFEVLDEQDKAFFRLYNIMVHGIDMHAGSIFDIIDTKIEGEFSDFMKELRTDEGYKDMDHDLFAKNIIRKNGNLAQYGREKGTPEFYKVNKDPRFSFLMERDYSPLTEDEKAFEEASGQKIIKYRPSINPHPDSFNSYSGYDTNTSYPKFAFLNESEIADLDNNKTVEINTFRRGIVLDDVAKTKDYFNFTVRDNHIASINDGDLIFVSKKSAFKSEITKNLPKDVLEAKIDKPDSRVANDMIDAFENMIQTALPNVRINRTFSDDPRNPSRKSMAFWYNGELWINQDRLQSDVPLHEIAHVPVMMLKAMKSPVYMKLRDEAIGLLTHPDADTDKIKANYGPAENLIDEVICNIVGWKGEKDVMATLMRYQHKNIEENSKGFWNTTKKLIKTAWETVRNYFNTLFGFTTPLKLDLRDVSIAGLSKELVRKIKAGEALSFVSSEEIARLMGNTMLQAKIERESVKDMASVENAFYKSDMNPEARYENKINNLKWYMVRNHQVPVQYGDVEYFDPESAGARKKMEELVKGETKVQETFDKDKITWLNTNEGKNIKNIGKERTGADGITFEPYKAVVYDKVRDAIDWNENTKYVQYSDLANMPEFKHLYDPSLISEGFNPVIGIDCNVPGAYRFSVFDLMPGTMKMRDMESVEGGLFRNLMRDPQLKSYGIEIGNDLGDLRKFQLGVLINHFMQNKIGIGNASVISIHHSGADVRKIDIPTINNTLRKIASQKKISEVFSGSIAKIIDPKNLKIYHTDARNDLAIWLKQNYPTQDLKGITVNKELDDKQVIYYLDKRLNWLEGDLKKKYTTKDYTQMKMIVATIEQLGSIPSMDHQINSQTNNDIHKFLFTDLNSIGDELIQKARKLQGDVHSSVIHEYIKTMDPLRKDGGAFDFFIKRDPKLYAESFASDVTRKIYDKLFVDARDKNGNRVNLNFIYWTKDDKEDPLWAKQARERNIPDDIIAHGKMIIDVIHNTLIKQLVSMRNFEKDSFRMLKSQGFTTLYTEEMAEAELKESGYKKGMIPIIQESAGALMRQGKFWSAIKKKGNDFTNLYDFMQEAPSNIEGQDLSKMRDIFTWQFGIDKGIEYNSEWGYNPALQRLLGLKQTTGIKEGKTISQYELVDDEEAKGNTGKKKNDQMSMDLEMITNFFVMQSIRNRQYEERLLPVINAMKLLDFHDKNVRDVSLGEREAFWDNWRGLAIDNKRKKLNFYPLGIDMDKVISNVSGSIAMPAVLLFNINIPAITAVSNGMFGFLQGISNSLNDALAINFPKLGFEKQPLFGAGHLFKASGAVLKDFHKNSQLVRNLQILAHTDYELVSLQWHQKTKKNIFSKWYMNWATWATDYYGRAVVMVAQMMRDGSYDAFVYDEKSGKVNYDKTKDKRLKWENGKLTEESQAYVDWVIQQNMKDGMTREEAANMGYTYAEGRIFRTLGDKYVVGAYSNKERSMLAATLIGRMFLMFRNWMMSRVENAVGAHKTLESISHVHMVKDDQGNFYPEWQRYMTEGYLTTVFDGIKHVIVDRNFNSYAHMTALQKQNYVKLAVNLAMFTTMMAMYNLFVHDKKKEKGMSDRQKFESTKFIPDIRMVRNIKYAYESLLVLPMIADMFTKPYAAPDILGPYWQTIFGTATKNAIPFSSQYKTLEELGNVGQGK